MNRNKAVNGYLLKRSGGFHKSSGSELLGKKNENTFLNSKPEQAR